MLAAHQVGLARFGHQTSPDMAEVDTYIEGFVEVGMFTGDGHSARPKRDWSPWSILYTRTYGTQHHW
jgi:hypothetical protein